MARESIELILIATDGSEGSLEAARHAAQLARALKARTLLLHVVPEESISLGTTLIPPATAPLKEGDEVSFERILLDGAQAILDRTRKPFDKLGVSVEGLIREGEAADGILAAAREEDVDLVVVGSHGHGAGAARALLGSTTERVVRESPCPVLVVRQ